LGNVAKAIEIYREMLEGPTTGFTVYAADRVSDYLYEEGKYEEAIPYYKKMEQISSNPDKIFHAQLQLMRCNYFIENWTNTSVYADKLLKSSQVNSEIQLWANYAKGLSNYYLENFNIAIGPLVWVVENDNTVKAFECKHALAYIYYKKRNYTLSDKNITELLKMKPSNNYWTAKGLILRTRVLIAQEDLFGAEEQLKSVLDHYPIEDDGIKEEANALWDELMQLKDTPKNIENEEGGEIEINGGGNEN